MTEEELRIIKYIKDNYAVYDLNAENLELATQIYQDGYKEGQKENAELKAQIEKMYTEEQVRECIDGACLDGQSGYDPSDLLINDYI